MGNIYTKISAIVRHDYFFYSILGVVVLQALWYALSFQPILFDETRHMGFIQAYTQYLSPFISQQSAAFDTIGEMTRDPSYLFYYLMSWPLRFISFFTDSLAVQLVFLRMISIAMVVAGLIYFRKAFLLAGAPRSITHLVLGFFMLTPTIALFPGAVHYDNAIFLLFAISLLLAMRIIKSPEPQARTLVILAILGLLGTLVKFTFVALFAPIALYILITQWRRHKREWWPKFRASFKKIGRKTQVALLVALALSVGMFIERPVQNIVQYRQIQPDCQKIIEKNRCNKNYTAKRNLTLLEKKPEGFKPINPFVFTLSMWTPGMIATQTNFIPHQPPVPVLLYLYYTFALGGIFILFVYLRDFLKNPLQRFLLVTTVGYAAFLFLYLFVEYSKYAEPVAISGRYLFQVMPIFMIFVGLSLAKLLQNRTTAKLGILALTCLIVTQGGGITSMLTKADRTYYWTDTTHQINKPVSEIADKLIFEKSPFQN